jgi:hypothetical protein
VKFSERLESLGFKSYADYLTSDHWKDFRQRYKDAGRPMGCVICAKTFVQLHHVTYVRLGEELFDDVIPVCRPHHVAIHDWLKASGRVFVTYTHEAVAALGGVCKPPKRAKKAKKPKRLRAADGDGPLVAVADCEPRYRELVEKLHKLPLSPRQIVAANKMVRAGLKVRCLAGLHKSVLLWIQTKSQPKAPPRNKAKKGRKAKKPKQPGSPTRQSVGGRPEKFDTTVIRDKWKDPLYAIRMLSNGHQQPPNKKPQQHKTHSTSGIPLCGVCGSNPRKANRNRCGRCIRMNRIVK